MRLIFLSLFGVLTILCVVFFFKKKPSLLPNSISVSSSAKKAAFKEKTMGLPIRAVFYDPTDEQSYLSLQKNVGKINLLLTEYMFIDPKSDRIYVNAQCKGAEKINRFGVKEIAMLSNFYGDDFNGETVHRILHDPVKQKRMINDIARILQSGHFSGVNIDLEEFEEDSDEALIKFMKELYGKLHPLGLLITIDVQPFNDDFNIPELARYNDYLFLMAYDEHNEDTGPGPVSSQRFIDSALRIMKKNMSAAQVADKVILCIAGYGYDWTAKKKAVTVSYQQAVNTAWENHIKIDYNQYKYNPNYRYKDKAGIMHNTYFTDAPTNLKVMNTANENCLAGVALWRFGLEDSRLWSFYDKPLQETNLKK